MAQRSNLNLAGLAGLCQIADHMLTPQLKRCSKQPECLPLALGICDGFGALGASDLYVLSGFRLADLIENDWKFKWQRQVLPSHWQVELILASKPREEFFS